VATIGRGQLEIIMNRYLAVLTLTGSIFGSLAAGAVAHAGVADSDLRSKKVYFTPAELLGNAGIGHVHQRLASAAREVCRDYESRELARQRVFRQCVAASLARALAEIHDPGLTAYHERTMGATPAFAAVVGSPVTQP
jgi:UrcA family protein